MREKKEQERQSRIRLGKRLEALRPATSVAGKLPAAEATPTIFDIVRLRHNIFNKLLCNVVQCRYELSVIQNTCQSGRLHTFVTVCIWKKLH